MAEITIPFGDEELSFVLPEHWTVQQTLQPNIASAPEDWPDRLGAVLARPEGTPPLAKMLAARRNGRIAVIVEDNTRHSPLKPILEVIFREFSHAEVPLENVEIFFAGGMHPPMTREEVVEKIGPELAETVAWRSNPWRDRDAYVRVGTVRDGTRQTDVAIDRNLAEADLRILVTSVSPHLQAGFGGGYKMLVPGCAAIDTIRQLHLAGLPRRATQQVGQTHASNRMRRLIDAAGRAIDAHYGKSFSVQYLLDMNDQPVSIAAGDVQAIQRMLAKKCAGAYGSLLRARADIVIANAYPRDSDLWQSFKAVAHCLWAARRGGVLICLTRCTGGVNMPTLSLPIKPHWVRRAVRLFGAETLSSLVIRLKPSLAGDAAFFARLALQVLQRNMVGMVSPVLASAEKPMAGLPAWPDMDAAIAAAEAELGDGPKRVVVFPAGGVSYPIIPRQGGSS